MENASLFEKLKPHIMAIQLICNEEHITEEQVLISIDRNYFDVGYKDEYISHTGDVWNKVRHHKHGDKGDSFTSIIEMMEG